MSLLESDHGVGVQVPSLNCKSLVDWVTRIGSTGKRLCTCTLKILDTPKLTL